ncbi:MAG: hypothetical protein HKO57_16240, partial [Akkermansiaceae bacterium]|nr:hypothetical protein [Akkermansiaceae bacterium]
MVEWFRQWRGAGLLLIWFWAASGRVAGDLERLLVEWVGPETLRLTWDANHGHRYQVFESADLAVWTPRGGEIVAAGTQVIEDLAVPEPRPAVQLFQVENLTLRDTDGDGLYDEFEQDLIDRDPSLTFATITPE